MFLFVPTGGGDDTSAAAGIIEEIEIDHESLDAIIFICLIPSLKYLPCALALGWALQHLIISVRSNGKKE